MSMQDSRNLREKLLARKSSLWNERSSWDSHWRDIAQVLLPRSGKFTPGERSNSSASYNKIYDSTGTRAHRVMAAGLMAGITSPARPWFRLATHDTDLMEYSPVKEWLFKTSSMMRDVFTRSNTYRALHSVYEELGAFGTASSIVTDDFDNVQHMHALTIGEYALATDYKGNVNTLCREFQMTVAQAVKEFGINSVSTTAKTLFEKGNLDAKIEVYHLIEPRSDRDVSKRDALNMAWRSCYFESGMDPYKSLRESGFDKFPVLAPRWAVRSGDIYGHSPGMEALGDIRQLQHEQVRKAEVIDYQTKPPITAPASLKNSAMDVLPGGVSFVDVNNPSGGIRTAFEVNLRLDYLLEDIRDVRERINQAFYADLFLMLANDTRSGITATEVSERHEEKMLMLGPVLERLHNELLSPMIEITFAKMVKAGILPPVPQELQNGELNVEFVSILAQAQRLIGVGNLDRYVSSIGAIAAVKPGVLDKFDEDQYADVLADALGIDPTIVVSDDKVALIRQQRAQAQQQQQQQVMAAQAAQTAKTLSETSTGGDNALNGVLSGLQGYT